MPKVIEAVYENGVIKPLKPLSLPSKRIVIYIEEKKFSELIDELELEARENVDETLDSVRGRDEGDS
ncbi:antitoxin family protein [Thermococcus sp.]|uniref:antitoxin family protein n=1 Tax=Thermococcus sp. TaxID=35749 RepID=UPI002631A1B3|nr:antitoxin family protein [Thermococcus sp.]